MRCPEVEDTDLIYKYSLVIIKKVKFPVKWYNFEFEYFFKVFKKFILKNNIV
jgi:hypothetical protein